MSAPIRVLLVDDHAIVRAGTAAMLAAPDIVVIAEAADGEEAVTLVAEHAPDVVLMDIRLPKLDGIAATERIRTRYRNTHVLVLSAFHEEADVLRAIAAGAGGYLLKDCARNELLEAVRTVARGGSVLAPAAASKLVSGMQKKAEPEDALTARELEVLRLVAKGSSNREVAKALRVSEATIKTHLLHLFPKLGVRDRTAAVTEALKRGLIQLDD